MTINLLRVGSLWVGKVLILRTRMKNLIIIGREQGCWWSTYIKHCKQIQSNAWNWKKKTFRVSSMSKFFSSLTIQESMGTLTGKRTFVEWLRICKHSIILVRKKGGLSKALKVLHRSMESAFQKKIKESFMRHLKNVPACWNLMKIFNLLYM